jgi:hypothetical protein
LRLKRRQKRAGSSETNGEDDAKTADTCRFATSGSERVLSSSNEQTTHPHALLPTRRPFVAAHRLHHVFLGLPYASAHPPDWPHRRAPRLDHNRSSQCRLQRCLQGHNSGLARSLKSLVDSRVWHLKGCRSCHQRHEQRWRSHRSGHHHGPVYVT